MFVFVLGGCGGVHLGLGCGIKIPDKDDWVAHNRALLRPIPVYPGARFMGNEGTSQNGGCGDGGTPNLPINYNTSRPYVVPSHVPARKTMRFLARALPRLGWKPGPRETTVVKAATCADRLVRGKLRYQCTGGRLGIFHCVRTYRRGTASLRVIVCDSERAFWAYTAVYYLTVNYHVA